MLTTIYVNLDVNNCQPMLFKLQFLSKTNWNFTTGWWCANLIKWVGRYETTGLQMCWPIHLYLCAEWKITFYLIIWSFHVQHAYCGFALILGLQLFWQWFVHVFPHFIYIYLKLKITFFIHKINLSCTT